ncbi:MAG: outer membrane lipoprotein-sorting protein [Gammaproteobacteria bacterium]|nr:outer membrane lipoprotein-sorting protein [Gammaproteobacteria bacterium]
MSTSRILWLTSGILLAWLEPWAGWNQALAESLSGLEIMERVEANDRAASDSAFNRMQLSSCRYGVKDNRITCAERPRIKSLESVGKNYGPEGKDTRSVTIVLEPAIERGVGMLTYAYDDSEKDNETWLYLSALGRVKRIASSNSDDDSEPASVFGSEFTTEDTDTGKLDEYSIRILEETTISGRDVWKIEMIPGEEQARKSRYSKVNYYVDKERFVTLRAEMFDQYDTEIKRLLAERIEQVNGVWLARSLTMMNLVSNRLSNMAFLEMYTGVEVEDDFLTARTLTDVPFRETELENLRLQLD